MESETKGKFQDDGPGDGAQSQDPALGKGRRKGWPGTCAPEMTGRKHWACRA